MNILLQLYLEFFKTGLFAIGGGLATLPFLQALGEKTHWFTMAQLGDMVAVSESTPGPMGINMATYVGYCSAGIPGAVIATLGLITPSIIVIILVAKVLDLFKTNRYVQDAFYGLRPASTALIASAGLSMLLMSYFRDLPGSYFDRINIPVVILGLVMLFLTRWCKYTKKLHPIIFIIVSAIAGVVFSL